jgi:hypothetical protein
MKQIWPNYSYSPATNVLTLTGLNIDRDQLLLVTAADRGRIMYNFADSSVTASAFTSGANTALTLVATTAGLTTTAALVIYYDDQVAGISGTVTANNTNLNRLVQDGEFTDTFGVPIIYARVAGGALDYWKEVSQISGLPVQNQLIEGGDIVPFMVSGTVTANPTGTQTVAGSVTIGAGTSQIGSVTASISGTVPVSGTFWQATQPVSLSSTTVTVSSLPALAAGTNKIGSVTASISGTVPISISSVTVGNSVTIGSLPAISGTVTANLSKPTWTNYSGTVVTANTAVTAISNTSRSYLLAQVTTGQMFLNIGATATTLNSVYFSAGQGFAWETSVPQGIVSIISAVTGTNYVLKEG